MFDATRLRRTVKFRFFGALTGTGAYQLFGPIYRGLGTVIALHGFNGGSSHKPQGGFAANTGLELTAAMLEDLLAAIRATGAEILALDDVHAVLTGKQRLDRPFACLTCDDGSQGTLDVAYPVLARHQVPFAVYVVNRFVERRAAFPWYVAGWAIERATRVEVRLAGKHLAWETSSAAQKSRAFVALKAALRQAPTPVRDAALQELIERHEISVAEASSGRSMGWDQVKTLARDPLVTIGAHTLSHPMLSRLEAPEVEREVQESKRQLEETLGRPVEHFAYPFGGRAEAGRREFEVVRRSGFKTAVTTRWGTLFSAHAAHRECLPRASIDGASGDMRFVKAILSGAIPAFKNRLQRVITE